ncbi:DUF3817 domain-containing protein [Mucilaginibacter sp. SMC90]|uniref:DUF3817 domain-containing protein n=1 Tax=Mucilaginibacter sp. SMC90 TaxID=2929803 RepID=UPI001FB435D2|nr:DUF3817 domain-containing protein [Mucilaginibacter sp. SMC90]UOE52522.1 DUF3817 domain-containing protein [Mucilaginibacter sp. SMC90]
MEDIFGSPLLRLKISAYAVGCSLLLLIGIALPLKIFLGQPSMLWFISPFHLALTCWYFMNSFQVVEEFQWKFSKTTWTILIGCLIPFGTFIVVRSVLNKNKLLSREERSSISSTAEQV